LTAGGRMVRRRVTRRMRKPTQAATVARGVGRHPPLASVRLTRPLFHLRSPRYVGLRPRCCDCLLLPALLVFRAFRQAAIHPRRLGISSHFAAVRWPASTARGGLGLVRLIKTAPLVLATATATATAGAETATAGAATATAGAATATAGAATATVAQKGASVTQTSSRRASSVASAMGVLAAADVLRGRPKPLSSRWSGGAR